MNSSTPKIIDHNYHFILPTSNMQSQLEKSKPRILKSFREELNNFKVDLIIELNEAHVKKYAYTPQEKYEKLKEKSNTIELLKKTFDLDI